MQEPWWLTALLGCLTKMDEKVDARGTDQPFGMLCVFCGYGSGGAGLSVPRSRLKTEVGTHDGIASSFATRNPITSISEAIVRGPLQSQSGRTVSVGW